MKSFFLRFRFNLFFVLLVQPFSFEMEIYVIKCELRQENLVFLFFF